VIENISGLSAGELQKLKRGEVLPVMEEFYSIQGEGFHSGTAAWFIRIGGCDVGCRWCDVKESWNPKHFPPVDTRSVVRRAVESGASTVVVTGGEPLSYNLDLLCDGLKANGIATHIESSGSDRVSGQWDWICLSPKKTKAPVEEIYSMADELKIIVAGESDLKWTEENRAKVGKDCRLFLQPEWSRREDAVKIIVDYVLKNPQWKVSLQIHKYMHIP
jgi:organic radical activating enzyme